MTTNAIAAEWSPTLHGYMLYETAWMKYINTLEKVLIGRALPSMPRNLLQRPLLLPFKFLFKVLFQLRHIVERLVALETRYRSVE